MSGSLSNPLGWGSLYGDPNNPLGQSATDWSWLTSNPQLMGWLQQSQNPAPATWAPWAQTGPGYTQPYLTGFNPYSWIGAMQQVQQGYGVPGLPGSQGLPGAQPPSQQQQAQNWLQSQFPQPSAPSPRYDRWGGGEEGGSGGGRDTFEGWG